MKFPFVPGEEYAVNWWEPPNAEHPSHLQVELTEKKQGYHRWMIYQADVQVLDNGKIVYPMIGVKKDINAPYYSQRDNVEEWWRTCSTSSHAMLLSYLKPGIIKSDDDYYRRFVKSIGDSTDWDVHTRALKKCGIDSVFRQDLSYKDLDASLAKNIPVPIGVLHKGSYQSAYGGHVLLIIKKSGESGYIAHDPWGKGFDYSDHDGAYVEYPKVPSLNHRWLPGYGFGRIVLAIDGVRTGLF